MNPSSAACVVSIDSRSESDRSCSRRPAMRPPAVAPKMMANSTRTRAPELNEKNSNGAPSSGGAGRAVRGGDPGHVAQT